MREPTCITSKSSTTSCTPRAPSLCRGFRVAVLGLQTCWETVASHIPMPELSEIQGLGAVAKFSRLKAARSEDVVKERRIGLPINLEVISRPRKPFRYHRPIWPGCHVVLREAARVYSVWCVEKLQTSRERARGRRYT